jgi:dihydrolipoamide dehydrogenase
MTIQADVAVLGGGPGGYTAAIRAAQLGKTVVIIEADKLGGTCLHRGCIPSKSLLRSAEIYATLSQAESYGFSLPAGEIAIRFEKVQERKQQAVDQLYRGLQYLMKKHKIEVVSGKGRVIGPSIFSPRSGAVAVELTDGEMETVVSSNLLLATGSRPRMLPGLPYDGVHIMNSDDILNLEQLPASILIVGGGVIGVEWASMLNDFGVEVTLIEAASRLLPGEDADISAELEKLLKNRGIRVLTSVQLKTDTCAVESGQVSLSADTGDGAVKLSAERMLVSVGRQANVEGLGLENTDIQVKDGFIFVNANMQTTEPHIYAIGDVNGGIQLAHAAAHEGLQAVEHLTGSKPHPIDPLRIPRCTYSRPEIASIGLTENQASTKGYDVQIGKIPFQAIGKAIVLGKTEGFVKVISDRATGDLLGVHMIGPQVTDLISEAALAQLLDASAWEVGQLIHPHPSLSEALGEAMLAIEGRALVF